MERSKSHEGRLIGLLAELKVTAGLVLLVAISREILLGHHQAFSHGYLAVQLVVCLLFLGDFFVRWHAADRKLPFFLRNLFFLLISVPWLNIAVWSHALLPRSWAMLLGLMPLVRAFGVLGIVAHWLVTGRIRQLFVSYLFTVLVFTYLSALVFYDYEIGVNPKLDGFGDALWWAWMNVTTVGAEIFAVTAVGKLFSVLLPSLGMMMFPIFTSYLLQEYAPSRHRSDS